MQKLEKWKRRLKGINSENIPEVLKEEGFKEFEWGIFINKKKRIVIKNSYLDSYKPRSDVVPTLNLRRSKHGKDCNVWLVQPLCNTECIDEEALERLDVKHSQCDVKKDNVGYYRNKLVLFDW